MSRNSSGFIGDTSVKIMERKSVKQFSSRERETQEEGGRRGGRGGDSGGGGGRG